MHAERRRPKGERTTDERIDSLRSASHPTSRRRSPPRRRAGPITHTHTHTNDMLHTHIGWEASSRLLLRRWLSGVWSPVVGPSAGRRAETKRSEAREAAEPRPPHDSGKGGKGERGREYRRMVQGQWRGASLSALVAVRCSLAAAAAASAPLAPLRCRPQARC